MPNRLATQTSAYLLQHRDNPVDWYPWGDEAWQRARRENRPVLVSIGYSSCHWCHVMERESFEDPEVAELMNRELVCIKVDREERPDVDQIYMDAIMHMQGQGGWPLNVFCAPDGRPFFGGTYFAPTRAHGRPSWSEVVAAVARAWHEQPDEVHEQARQLVAALAARPSVPGQARISIESLGEACRRVLQRADSTYGGFGSAPKFPTPPLLELLLAAAEQRVAPAGAMEHLELTLERMARGGLFDQLGGGFHRYSTDSQWLVPHFEKMLYDNGQLLHVYARAAHRSPDDALAWPLEETVGWLEREMRSAEGGFYASQDADSEGEEGRYFVWTPGEIEAELGPDEGRAFCDAYGVTPGGNFEHSGRSVLSHGLAGSRDRFAAARARLLAARTRRVAPATDTKQLCAWIGYTISGLSLAAGVLDRPEWLDAARRAGDFVLERLSDSGRDLRRIWDGREAQIPAFLDDHAALLCGLLDLHRAGGDERFIEAAVTLGDEIRTHFYDPDARELFLTRKGDETLVYRPSGDLDGATPSAIGLALLGLVRLVALTDRDELRGVAKTVLDAYAPLAVRAPMQLATLLRAGALLDAEPGLALVLGDPDDPRTRALAARARHLLDPEDAVVVVRPDAPPTWLASHWLEGRHPVNGAPTAYVCRGRVCSLPARTPEELVRPG